MGKLENVLFSAYVSSGFISVSHRGKTSANLQACLENCVNLADFDLSTIHNGMIAENLTYLAVEPAGKLPLQLLVTNWVTRAHAICKAHIHTYTHAYIHTRTHQGSEQAAGAVDISPSGPYRTQLLSAMFWWESFRRQPASAAGVV